MANQLYVNKGCIRDIVTRTNNSVAPQFSHEGGSRSLRHVCTCSKDTGNTHMHFSLYSESLLIESSISSAKQTGSKSEGQKPGSHEVRHTHRHTNVSYHILKHSNSLTYCLILLLLSLLREIRQGTWGPNFLNLKQTNNPDTHHPCCVHLTHIWYLEKTHFRWPLALKN